MSNSIALDDPRHAAAMAVMDAMHAYWKLDPFGGAVRWIEDMDGRVVIYTRGEYRVRLMKNIDDLGIPVKEFEHRTIEGSDDETES